VKKKPQGSCRTSIKNSTNLLSAQSYNCISTQSLTKTSKRSSILLKQKVKEIENKMSGKKIHVKDKSRNLENTLSKHQSCKKGALESIPEFRKKLKRN
jgi:hypothetical protein